MQPSGQRASNPSARTRSVVAVGIYPAPDVVALGAIMRLTLQGGNAPAGRVLIGCNPSEAPTRCRPPRPATRERRPPINFSAATPTSAAPRSRTHPRASYVETVGGAERGAMVWMHKSGNLTHAKKLFTRQPNVPERKPA